MCMNGAPASRRLLRNTGEPKPTEMFAMGGDNGAVSSMIQPYSVGEATSQSFAPITEDIGRRTSVKSGDVFPSEGVFMPLGKSSKTNVKYVEKGAKAPTSGTFVPRTISNVDKKPWEPQKSESVNNVLDHKRTRDHRQETLKARAAMGPTIAPMGILGVLDPLERTQWRCYNHAQIEGHKYLRPWGPEVEMKGRSKYTERLDCDNFGMKSQDDCFKACDRIPECAWIQWAPMLAGDKNAKPPCRKVGQCLLISRFTTKGGEVGLHHEASVPVKFTKIKVQQLCIRPKRNAREKSCHETCPVQCSRNYYRMIEVMQERAGKNKRKVQIATVKEKATKKSIQKQIDREAGTHVYKSVEQVNATVQKWRKRLESKEALEKHQLRIKQLGILKKIQQKWTEKGGLKDQDFVRATTETEQSNKLLIKDKQLLEFEQKAQDASMEELKQSEGYEIALNARSPRIATQRAKIVNETLALSSVHAFVTSSTQGHEANAAELTTKAKLTALMHKVPNRKPPMSTPKLSETRDERNEADRKLEGEVDVTMLEQQQR